MSNLRTAAQQALEALEQFGLDNPHRSYELEHAVIAALKAALAQQADPVEPVAWVASKDGRVIYDDASTDDGLLRVSGDFENDEQRISYAKQIVDKLNAASAQQKDPTDPGHDVDVLREHVRHLERRVRELHAQQAEPTVTEDMKSAVRWAPSSAYWSQRLREFFGPDAREGIDALERRLAKAQQSEQDLSRCPQCNGPADNGFDRSFPPSPYLCTKCMAEPVAWECKAGGLKRLTQRLYDMQPDSIKRHYTRIAPPQRTMVPLTEEEIFKIENDIPDDVISDRAWTICLTRAVEKAVWEKNHGQA